uniref:Uncharacterized protein n=1 Tax=Heterorhabditis bacteriophora TaxID=37862 RepID=A0A1I7WHT4_HETBA
MLYPSIYDRLFKYVIRYQFKNLIYFISIIVKYIYIATWRLIPYYFTDSEIFNGFRTRCNESN